MKPQRQTVFGPEEGNCYATCVASLLDLDVSELPNFCHRSFAPESRWLLEANEWLAVHAGVRILHFAKADWVDDWLPDVTMIAAGKSPRFDCEHAVLWRAGRMIWDPHPDEAGLDGGPTGFDIVIPLRPVVARRPVRTGAASRQVGSG